MLTQCLDALSDQMLELPKVKTAKRSRKVKEAA